MDKSIIILITSIILMVVGVVMVVASIGMTIQDPKENAKATVETDIIDLTDTVHLDSGEYEIWYEEELFDFGEPGDIAIMDEDGAEVYISTGFSQSMSVNGRDYEKAGSFDADESGDYTFVTEYASTLYITEEADFGLGVTICFSGIAMGIVGGILLIVGLYFFFTRKKKPKYPAGQPQPPYSSSGSPPPPPPPPPPGQYPPPPPPY